MSELKYTIFILSQNTTRVRLRANCLQFLSLARCSFCVNNRSSYCRGSLSWCQIIRSTYIYTGLFISPSGISELDCATTKTDTAERSISIGTEFLQVFFFVLGALAYFQVPPLGGSHEEKWRSQWIRKRSVSWNLTKLSRLWLCNGGFGSCTT